MPTLPMRSWSNQKLSPYRRPDNTLTEVIKLAPAGAGASVQYQRGQILAQRTDTGTYFDKYLTSGATGTGTAKCILMYDCAVDENGFITLMTGAAAGATTPGDELGLKTASISAYFSGIFRVEDLLYNAVGPTPTVGVTAAILTDLAGRLNWGSITAGEMQF